MIGLLENKVAVITGAARGQGAATARMFADHGARLMLTDLDGPAASATAAGIGADAIGNAHDIRSETEWAQVVAEAMAKFERIDILINNAGIFFEGPMGAASMADMDRAFQVNVGGAFLGISAVLPHLEAGASIVNIASGAALSGMADMIAYSTSKWALRGMSRSAARDLAPRGIRVNTVCPGVIDTPMIRNDALPGFFDQVKVGIPLGRTGTPDEIAAASLYLASDASSFMTGAEMVVDGGRHA